MRALHKSKRVSWPPDFKLCQVRLFISEDSPSQVGSESQDHLQAKSHPSEDNLPPGFGGPLSANEPQIKLSDIPVIKWICSVRIVLDEEWRVVAGEESKEVETQNQRELRVLEAFYPGASAIPPNPSVLADVDNSDYDDQQTVVIPILPVEDDDIDPASDLPVQSGVDVVGTEPSRSDENTSVSSTLPAASEIMAALTAISNNKELGSGMIDQELLMKILSNPKLVENLVANSSGAGSVSSNAGSLYLSSTHEANGVTTSTPASSNGQYYPQPTPSLVYPPPTSSDQPNYGAPPARDASYYKSLIQQHGGERQEAPPPVQQHLGYRYNNPQPGGGLNPEMVNSNNNNNQRPPRDSKQKIMKPCMYFNSSRGCRNGANCLFQHDATAYQPRNPNNGNTNNPEMQTAKRMRFDRD
ncbi:Zinc finger CCCH domain-containing protein 6 [Raphanus sativus]|uniref:Zinc finger CCCH domain-containing protein 6 n=1 Tax=Raphanus sativus TaxID=3726 RepID=A0A6J0KNG4_RAPSA|nr:zinc finger CCCH domain-containing protein 6 [Raphanus sativus]KAJ4868866.1 Zinc finger CCCH domain-containing protein 6 [Raphanus sativus]